MTDRKTIRFITPRGVAIWPRLNAPDTKWKPEGEYSCKIRLTPDALPEDLVEKLEALRDEKAEETRADLKTKKQGAKIKSLKTRDLLTPETDRETGEETGFVLLNAKMRASGVSKKTGKPWTRKPAVFDAKGKPIDPVPNIYGGSEVKLAVEAQAYYTPKDNEVGIAFYLEAAQVLKLVVGNGQKTADGYGFGEEEGFEADANESGFEDESGGDDATGSGDEF